MTPRSVYGQSFNYINLAEKANLMFEALKLEQKLINMLQLKVYICYETLKTVHEFAKSEFKNQKPRTHYLGALEHHGKY